MTNRKRLLAVILSLIAVVSVIAGGVFCSADEADWGTFEDGMYHIGKHYWIQTNPPYLGGEGLANGDFQQGYKYWAHNFGKKPSDVTQIKKEGDNYYLHFNGEQCQSEWEGICSPRFLANGVQEGTPVAILYKWRGDTQFQLYLEQWDMNPDEVNGTATRVSSSGYTTVISEAYNEGEWNIGVTSGGDGIKGVLAPQNGLDRFYFLIGIQISTDVSAVFDIDDVQLVIRQTNGIVTDLAGKQLYDLNNLETRVVEETDFDFGDFDLESKKEPMPGPEGLPTTLSAVIESAGKKDVAAAIMNPASPWFWVVVSAGVIIIIAAAVVIVLLIKKKKSSEEADETAENAGEETETSEDISEETTDEE